MVFIPIWGLSAYLRLGTVSSFFSHLCGLELNDFTWHVKPRKRSCDYFPNYQNDLAGESANPLNGNVVFDL